LLGEKQTTGHFTHDDSFFANDPSISIHWFSGVTIVPSVSCRSPERFGSLTDFRNCCKHPFTVCRPPPSCFSLVAPRLSSACELLSPMTSLGTASRRQSRSRVQGPLVRGFPGRRRCDPANTGGKKAGARNEKLRFRAGRSRSRESGWWLRLHSLAFR
jgi:hypothetical protein